MFKSDKSVLDELSFNFSETEIATLAKTLNYLKTSEYSTLSDEEILGDLEILTQITQLKLDQKYYAFHVDDSWSLEQSGYGSGVSLYLRQGDRLQNALTHFCLSTRVPQESDICSYLSKNNISNVYTGNISFRQDFLGIPKMENSDGECIEHSILQDDEIDYFTSKGIEIILLDSLL